MMNMKNINIIDILENSFPKEAEGILIALSGGPDSMVLLDLLLQLRKQKPFRLIAAHLNHKLRSVSDGELRFVNKYCNDRNVECITQSIDVKSIATHQKLSIETAARNARYAFLRDARTKSNSDWIALAHHKDDQAETVLLNLFRGAGLAGLRGMPEYKKPFWRPLLPLSKNSLLNYAKKENIPYCLDASNNSMDYTRNRLRYQMKFLEEIHPSVVDNIARTSKLLQLDEHYIHEKTIEREFYCKTDDNTLDIAKLMQEPAAIRSRIIRRYAACKGLLVDLERKHIDALQDLCSKKSGSSLNLPHNFCAQIEYGCLQIKKNSKSMPTTISWQSKVFLGENITPYGTMYIEEVEAPNILGEKWPHIAEFHPDILKNALIRTRRPGDRIQILGCSGSKKLKDFWIDRKVIREKRNTIMIAKGSEILYIPSYAISQKASAHGCKKIWQLSWSSKAIII